MKITAAVTIAMAAGFTGQAKASGEHPRTVIVYIVNEYVAGKQLTLAKDQSAKMFAQIGISIQWRSGVSCSLPHDAMVVEIMEQASQKRCAGALACAKPFEGVHISVFYDRIRTTVPDRTVSPLLAHVLVHEITHILQGVDRHSETGIMKARWDVNDFEPMAHKHLNFCRGDVLLIERGFDARESRAATAANTSWSAAGSL